MIVTDTAGLRETLDPIEAEGVALAQQTALQADLVLSVLDCTALPDLQHQLPVESSQLQTLAAQNSSPDRNGSTILVLNKADALSPEALQQLKQQMALTRTSSASTDNGKSVVAASAAVQPPTADMQQSLHPTNAQLLEEQSGGTAGTTSAGATDGLLGVAAGASRVVHCSCKTGLNMELLTDALEGAVQDMMQQGQEAAESFAITRCLC